MFNPGDKVEWAGETYTVWSLHDKSGWRWITRDGKPAIPAKMSSLRLLETAPTPSGLERKEVGMAQALDARDVAEWKESFRRAVREFEVGRRFTSEDVIAVVGLPSGAVASNANNAVGAMVNGLAKRGLIRKTEVRVQSRRSSSHGAELIVWERAS